MQPAVIRHLCQSAHLTDAAAQAMFDEFWKGSGEHTPQSLAALLRQASDPSRMPLCLIVCCGEQFAGVANLIDNDDPERMHLHPWLAGVVILPAFRGRGLGAGLVLRMIGAAREVGYRTVYLGTDSPEFYQRLGGRILEWKRPGLAIMAVGSGEE